MLQMMSCLLRVETRDGLKVIKLVLQDWLSDSKGALSLRAPSANGETSREHFWKSSVKNLFNNEIIGDSTNKHQWDMPLEDDPKKIGRRLGIVNFENAKVRKIIDNINETIDVSHDSSEIKND